MKKIKSLMFAIVIGVSFLLSACTDDEPLMEDSKNENSQVTNNQGESVNDNDGSIIDDDIAIIDDEIGEIDSGNKDEIIGVVMEINRDDTGNLVMMVNEGFFEISDAKFNFGSRLDPDSWIEIDFTNAEIKIIEVVDGEATPERLGDVNDIQVQQHPVRIQLSESKLDDNTLIAASIIVYHGLGQVTFE